MPFAATNIMFGYLNITKNLPDGQRGLWQTFMCGLCFSTKKLFGNIPRLVISHDINFFNVLFHSVEQLDVQVEHTRCFSHPVKKRPVLKTTELTDKLAAANVLLTYLNIYDDVVDGGGAKKRAALRLFKKPYARAQSVLTELDRILTARYDDLRKLEGQNCQSLDRVADSFAMLSQDFCKVVLGEKTSEFAETLCYNLGKWIYLIDALDDVKKDLKHGNYNAFVSCYGIKSANEISAYSADISFLMYAVLNRIAQSFNDLNLTKYTCLLKNVLFFSIREKTKEVLAIYNG